MLRSLEQERAKYAWDCIQEVKKESEKEGDEKLQKDYKSYVRRASTLIQANGLPNALAFYYNRLKKGEKAYELLYNHIAQWSILKKLTKNKDPLQWIREEASSVEIFKATKEVIALLNWMKRFAEAELKGEEI